MVIETTNPMPLLSSVGLDYIVGSLLTIMSGLTTDL
jgi:hypothetical protein